MFRGLGFSGLWARSYPKPRWQDACGHVVCKTTALHSKPTGVSIGAVQRSALIDWFDGNAMPLRGGSWVVIYGVISPLIWVLRYL